MTRYFAFALATVAVVAWTTSAQIMPPMGVPGMPPVGPNGVPAVGPNGMPLSGSMMPMSPTGVLAMSPGALVITQPNTQTYAVADKEMTVVWQPVDPGITLASLPPNLVIECFPEIPITVGGPFGFAAIVRTDSGQYKYKIPKGWAGESWMMVLREQGGSQIIAGQRFAIKPEGTALAPTTNINGNTAFTPGNPQGWPVRSAAADRSNMGAVSLAIGASAAFVALAVV
jgi:hypothetical protein